MLVEVNFPALGRHRVLYPTGTMVFAGATKPYGASRQAQARLTKSIFNLLYGRLMDPVFGDIEVVDIEFHAYETTPRVDARHTSCPRAHAVIEHHPTCVRVRLDKVLHEGNGLGRGVQRLGFVRELDYAAGIAATSGAALTHALKVTVIVSLARPARAYVGRSRRLLWVVRALLAVEHEDVLVGLHGLFLGV